MHGYHWQHGHKGHNHGGCWRWNRGGVFTSRNPCSGTCNGHMERERKLGANTRHKEGYRTVKPQGVPILPTGVRMLRA